MAKKANSFGDLIGYIAKGAVKEQEKKNKKEAKQAKKNSAPEISTDAATGPEEMTVDQIMKDIEKAQEKANLANEERYTEGKDILQGSIADTEKLYGGAQDEIRGSGSASIEELLGGVDKARDLYGQAGTDLGKMDKSTEIMQGAKDETSGLYGQAAGQLDLVGGGARRDISAQANRQQAQGMQDLVSRGLGNSTILNSMSRGVASDRRRAMMDAEEADAARRAGLMERQAGAMQGANTSIANAMSNAGQAQAGLNERQAGTELNASAGVAGSLERTGTNIAGVMQNQATAGAQGNQALTGFIEGRTDAGPNLGFYGDLIQGLQGQQIGDTMAPITAGEGTTGGSKMPVGAEVQPFAPTKVKKFVSSPWNMDNSGYFPSDAEKKNQETIDAQEAAIEQAQIQGRRDEMNATNAANRASREAEEKANQEALWDMQEKSRSAPSISSEGVSPNGAIRSAMGDKMPEGMVPSIASYGANPTFTYNEYLKNKSQALKASRPPNPNIRPSTQPARKVSVTDKLKNSMTNSGYVKPSPRTGFSTLTR